MKILVIPDVHLKPDLFNKAEEIIQKEKVDNVVCLMDIPDDWNKQYDLQLYENTFDAAIDFVKKYPDSRWCFGNHDLSYIWSQSESGYSYTASSLVNKKLTELMNTLSEDNPIRYIQRIDNVLFCHGGLCQNFVDQYVPISKQDDIDETIIRINGLGRYEMWKDDSPIWLRPQYFQRKMYQEDKILQVVGHTPVEKIIKDRNIISCDTFSTYQNGTPIGVEKFLIIDTESWDYYCVP